MKHIEIVVPCYNEQQCVEPLFKEIQSVLEPLEHITYSVLFVNDGSKDRTIEKIKNLATQWGNKKVHYISFARNFGKEAAIYAGLSNSIGDYVVLMDADLQHPPKLILEMLAAMDEGYDCCGARRVSREGEPPLRSAFSNLFYKIINHVTSMRLVPGGSDYRMMSRKMVNAIVSLPERERFTKGIMSWVGFDTKWITYENVERFAGNTKWSFMGLAKYAWNGFLSFATTPLRVAVYLGMLVVITAVIYFFTVFIQALRGDRVWTEGTTLILLLLAIGGTIIVILGVIGEYLARIYLELKHRPIYIEKESNISKNG